MAKKKLRYGEGVSFLGAPGTLVNLRSVAYFRGKRGRLGAGAREIMERGMESFLASLTPDERKRFKEIQESVRLAESLRGEVTTEVQSSLPQ